MAEEDNEVLDWGNEDDVVSLGDEDERYTQEDPALPPQNGNLDAPVPNTVATPPRPPSPLPLSSDISTATPDQKSSTPARQLAPSAESSKSTSTLLPQASHKLPIPPRMTHALPPKPVTTNIPYVPPSDPSIVEATAMASRPKKGDNTGQNLKNGSRYDHIGPLPAPWEIRIPRSGEGHYYHNNQSGLTQWNRPSTPTPTDPPPLSHDDRHYRPSGDRYAPASGRRYESSADASDSRHNRHHPGTSTRSPPRGRDRSKSTSPGRDSRSRGSQRPARGRASTKTNGPQRELHVADLSKDEDRHWVPSPPPNNQTRSARRWHRSRNHSTDGRIVDSGSEDAGQLPHQRENSTRGYNRDRERPYTSSEHSNHTISTPRPATPPSRDDRNIIYEAKAEVQRREVFEERRRSPSPTIDQSPPPLSRRERPSRFGPGLPSALERPNGLPMKPATAHDDRSGEFKHANNERQYDKRMDQDRRYDNPAPRDPTYTALASRSLVQARESDRSWVSPANGGRGRASSVSENLSSSSSRKRQPLPPQEAEFRGIAKSKSAVYSDSAVQRPRDASRSPAITFHSREKPEKDVATPAPRSYPRRDDTRDSGYSQPPPREPVPADYERDYRNLERARPRQHHNDQNDADRGYDTPAGPPSIDARGGYQERERDPPSKPRAMQGPAITSTNAYTVAGPSSIPSNLTNRYRDRPSPPHLSTSDSRRDVDARTNPPPGAWLEREEERVYTPLEHPPSREPRGRLAPASSANSVPIGARRAFAVVEPAANDYASGVSGNRYERSSYSDGPLRSARNYDEEYPRSYLVPEPVPEFRQNYPRVPREDSYLQVNPGDRGRRVQKVEAAPRGPIPLTSSGADNAGRQHPRRFSPVDRNSRPDQELLSDPPLSKTWPANYDTSPRGRYTNDLARDATPPPMSRESSFTSPQWDPPSSSHEPPPRSTDYRDSHGYRDSSPRSSRMDVDIPLSRQAQGVSGLHNAPAVEHYRHKEAGSEGSTRTPLPPPPRVGNRRDQVSYSPDTGRAPVADVSMDSIGRGSGRAKRDPTNAPFDGNLNQRAERPRMLNERISGLPPPEGRGSRKQPQGIRQNNGYNGEPDAFEPHFPERVNTRQDDHAPSPAKTFEQRLDLVSRPPMSRGASLLSRISRGSDDVQPPPPSLRDRVQIGTKRDRDDMARGHNADPPFETDDGETDLAGGRKNRKRRRGRRGGAPS